MKRETEMEQKILEVAENLFFDQGYEATTTIQIAQQVICNQALIYYYFENKAHLFEVVFDRKFKTLSSFFFLYDRPELIFADRLKLMINGLFDLFESDERIAFFLLSELRQNSLIWDSTLAHVKILINSAMPTFCNDLEKEIAAGRIRRISPYNLLMTMISLCISPFLFRPIVDRALDFSEQESLDKMRERREENVTIIMRSLMP